MSSPQERLCPVNGQPMHHVHIQGVEVDRSARGLWLDKGELLRITEGERAQVGTWQRIGAQLAPYFRVGSPRPELHDAGGARAALPCPVCRSPMRTDSYQQVGIDRCQVHGVWLDPGELGLILRRLKADPTFMRGMTLRLADGEF